MLEILIKCETRSSREMAGKSGKNLFLDAVMTNTFDKAVENRKRNIGLAKLTDRGKSLDM